MRARGTSRFFWVKGVGRHRGNVEQAEGARRKEHVAIYNFEKRSEFRFHTTRRKRDS